MSAPTTFYDLRPVGLSSDAYELAAPWLCILDPLPNDGSNYGPFTVEHWLYLRSNTANAGVLTAMAPGSSWDGTGVNLYIRSEAGAGYAFTVSGSHLRIGTPPLDTWVHLAWVWTGTEVQIWENATLLDTESMVSLPVVNDYWHAQYESSTTDPAVDGDLGRLRFWGKALTASEVADARDNDTPTDTTDLLRQYDFTASDAYELPVTDGPYALLLNYAPFGADFIVEMRERLTQWPARAPVSRRFDSDTLGALPGDWQPVWRAGLEAEVVAIDDLLGYSRALEVTATQGNRCGLRWMLPDDAAHGEMLLLQRMAPAEDGINFVGAFIGGAGTDENDTTATMAIAREPRRVQAPQYADGSFDSGLAEDARFDFDFREWHWLRARFTRDGRVTHRYWYVGWREPAEWLIEETYSIPAGWIGWSCAHSTGHQLADFRFTPDLDTLDRTEPQTKGLAGSVENSDGNPVEGREVRIYKRLDGEYVDTVFSDENGQWEWRFGQDGIEYYALAINTENNAEDYTVMCANRVVVTEL